MKKVSKQQKTLAGEEALALVDSVTLTINGQDFAFVLDDELSIPDSLDDIELVARTAPSKQAFWDGQMERALHDLRKLETRLKEVEGTANKWCRKQLEGEREGELVAENAVQAAVDCRKDVVTLRHTVSQAKYNYGILRSVRDAVSQRVYVLTRLAGNNNKTGGSI